jgi:single-strand DNA-binding protein
MVAPVRSDEGRHNVNNLPLPIVGNLTKDPELRFTPTGVAVVKFAIAHNPRFRNAAGEWTDGEPTYLDCNAWRDLAEHIVESLKSGSRVIAFGNLTTHWWESDGRDGGPPKGTKLSRMTLGVIACGPELTYATAQVTKAVRTRAGETAPDDPWATASKTRPANADAGAFDVEPAF